ncbi:mesa protein [Epithele typhae]|uniref:mesa protein n=1 Tax=Epithele typhae TaxID=378194 RepID=UPI0020072C97|nr:mesa protein [Epithele typhae]KAH9941624.1 mesa protein [Epithele typhae]
MSSDAQHCSFVLVADFDIDRGAQLTYQFPQPLGLDEGILANLMLPDGAERQPADWTVFFLNQTPFNTIKPILALENDDAEDTEVEGPKMLYVINLVRTKLDKTVRRGATVKAMAICTRYPFVQIFKPVLLLALDDYFMNPSQDCLARLFDAVNAMDFANMPVLSRWEKIILRNTERQDVLLGRYDDLAPGSDPTTATQATTAFHPALPGHRPTNSADSRVSFDDAMRAGKGLPPKNGSDHPKAAGSARSQASPSEASFSLDGSAVWVGDESGLDQMGFVQNAASASSTSVSTGGTRGRRSVDASSSSSHGTYGNTPSFGGAASAALKDSHFFHTAINYNEHLLPVKVPLGTFPGEVGEGSLTMLCTTFSQHITTISGPQHPHLHTNGTLTPPVIVLFNALITGKRIIFLGHHKLAENVSNHVLAACALGSGCGIILRGFIKRAFPYATLINRDEWENVPGYIAGVTNPIFEAAGSWDLLCDIGTNRMVVHKDIFANHPALWTPAANSLISRAGTIKAEQLLGEDDAVRGPTKDGGATQKPEFTGRPDSTDNVFIEDILSAIAAHYSEAHVRAKFAEYALRFVHVASRYEEDALGTTAIGYPTAAYAERAPNERPRLGSGPFFADDGAAGKELAANAGRIEAWRRTECYKLFQEDFTYTMSIKPIAAFDLSHQLARLRYARSISDREAEAIFRSLSENLNSYDQVTELLSWLPPHLHGLQPLSFGLFHQSEVVRELTVDLFNQLREHPIGVQYLQALNHFQRYAYVRQAHARELHGRDSNALTIPATSYMSRTPSNRSVSSLTSG